MSKPSRRAIRRNRHKNAHTIERQQRTIIIKCQGRIVGAQDFPLEDWMSGGQKWIKETLDAHKEVCHRK